MAADRKTTTRRTATPKRAPAARPSAATRAAAGMPHPVPSRAETLRPPGAAAAAAEPPGPLNGLPLEPVRLSTKPVERAEPEPRITLFYVDGKAYDVPAEPSPSVALQFMHIAAQQSNGGMDVKDALAVDQLITDMPGEDGWEALRSFKALKLEEFQRITEIATIIALGAIELPRGPAGE